MADLDYSQLTSITAVGDTDLVATYPSGGPLRKITWLNFVAALTTKLSASFLQISNNLADVGSASAARGNLGLGSAATLASGAVFQVANNFNEVANAATARMNLAAAGTASPQLTGVPNIAPGASVGAGNGDIWVTAAGLLFAWVNGAAAQVVPTYIHVSNQQSNGVANPETPATGVWTKRTLNTVVVNTVTGATLVASQLSLPAGTYEVTLSHAPLYLGGGDLTTVQHRLRNVTDSANLLVGVGTLNIAAAAGFSSVPLIGQFTLSATKTVELDIWISAAGSLLSAGAAASSGAGEVYTNLYLRKIA